MVSVEAYSPQENRASFMGRLSGQEPIDKDFIMFSYDFAKVAHHGQVRDGGKRYFEHVRNVALVLIDEVEVKDPEIIASALLHDTGEDSAVYGSNKDKTNSEWREKALGKMTALFGDDTGRMVMYMTKPFVDAIEVKDKPQKDRIYHAQLVEGGPKVILIKMADRLDNLRSLGARSHENQQKIVKETEEEYYPLFETIRSNYPKEVEYLINEMKIAIANLSLI